MFKSYISKELKELINQKSKKPNGFDYDVLTVSNTGGFIKQLDYFEDRVIASSDKKNYKKVIKNDFAYNPARINVGSIARLKNIDIGIVSPMYLVFNTTDELEPVFLEYFFQSNNFHNQMNKLLSGSVRKTLDFSSLEKIKIKVFDNKDQQKIGSFLSAIDKLLTLKDSRIKKLENLKKYHLKYSLKKIYIKNTYTLTDISEVFTGNLNAENSVENGEFTFFDRSSDIKRIDNFSFDGKAIIYAGEGSEFLPRKFDGKFGLHQRAYAIMNFKDCVDYEYLYYYLETMNNHFLKTAVGTTVKSLRKVSFEKCKINLPSLEKQIEIKSFLKNIDKYIQLLKAEYKNYLEFKNYYLEIIFK
jgi:type I restriction enzyme, S subunit